jgi:hypothetical protein
MDSPVVCPWKIEKELAKYISKLVSTSRLDLLILACSQFLTRHLASVRCRTVLRVCRQYESSALDLNCGIFIGLLRAGLLCCLPVCVAIGASVDRCINLLTLLSLCADSRTSPRRAG